MPIFTLEHSRFAYRADFAVYGGGVIALASIVAAGAPRHQLVSIAAVTLTGLVSWSLIEYLVHRFVLHGIKPFSAWHTLHHDRPAALICAPTAFTAGLFVFLVFLPSLALGSGWRAAALTLGVLAGYLAYAITHHATHHWHGKSRWLKRRKRWHAAHHHVETNACFGVTSVTWDRLFGTAGSSRKV